MKDQLQIPSSGMVRVPRPPVMVGAITGPVMGRLICAVALIALLAISSVSAAAERPVLPVRGEKLLDEMRSTPLPPMPRESFLSPSGDKLLYTEATYHPPYGIGYSDHLSPNPDWKLWLQDVATGDRAALPIMEDSGLENLDAFRIGRKLAPRWSADGSQVAFLEQRDGSLSLVVFATAPGVPATRIALPDISVPNGEKESVTDWYWDSSQERLLLGLEVGTSGYQARALPKREQIAWDWILSRDQRPADGKREAVAPRCNRVVMVNLQNAKAEQAYPCGSGDGLRLGRETGEDPWTPGLLNWRFTGSGSALLRLRDPAVAGTDDAKLRWQMHVGDPQVSHLRDARSSVHALDLETGVATKLLTAGAGRIARATPDRDGESYAIVQGTAGTSNWPMHGDWGELSWRLADDRKSIDAIEDASPVVVSSDSLIFASDRPGVVYQYDPLLLKLAEISRSTARPVDLGLPGLSITHCDVSTDGSRISAVFESATTPPEIHVWNSATRRWKRVAGPKKRWKNPGGVAVEHVTWRSRDDVFDVDGFLIKPPNFDPRKRYPMLVMLSGGNALRTVRFSNRFDPMYGGGRAVGGPPGAIYASAGYLVFLPNHRGSAGAGIAANRAFVGQYGRHLDLDVFSGIDMLVDKGWADPERLGVIGHSHGGDEAYYGIAHSTRFKAALINDSPILMPEFFVPYHEGNADILRPWYGADIMKRMIGQDPVHAPWADPDAIRTPLLLRWAARYGPNELEQIELKSGWDRQGIGSTTTYALIHALRRNGVPIEVVIDQDEHQVENPKYMLEWQSRLLQWFDFFVQGKGENPIPAMASPFDYDDDLQAIRDKAVENRK